MHELKFSDLKDQFRIITHPGGSSSPMCARLGAIYRETRADNELIQVPDAEIFAIFKRPGGRSSADIQIARTRASLEMTRRVQVNGLIKSAGHPFRGFWANALGFNKFLLGRPNQNTATGVVQSYFPDASFYPDLETWLGFKERLSSESSESIEASTLVL